MKRTLAVLAGLCLSVGLSVGVASAGRHATTKSSVSGNNTTKTSFATITHTCTDRSSDGGGALDDGDGDHDTITFEGPTVLWPPNHKYVKETITATDVDSTGEDGIGDDVKLMTTATSNQPGLGMGSGNTLEDAVVATPSNGEDKATQNVFLRAERDGVDPTKEGRTYTIKATATFDSHSPTVEMCHATFTVHVPHDQHH